MGAIDDKVQEAMDWITGEKQKRERAERDERLANDARQAIIEGTNAFMPTAEERMLEFGTDVRPYDVGEDLRPIYGQHIPRGASEWENAVSAAAGKETSRFDQLGPSNYAGISSAYNAVGPSSFQGKSSAFDRIGGSSFDDLYGSAYDAMGPNAFATLGDSAYADLGGSSYGDLGFDEGRMVEAEDYFADLKTAGRDEISDADMARRVREAEQMRRAHTEGALADAEMRGQGGGGAALLGELAANQGMTSDLYQAGMDAAAMSAMRRDSAAQQLGSLAERRARGELDADTSRAAGEDEWAQAIAGGMDDYDMRRAEGLETSGATRAAGLDAFSTTRAAGQDDFRTSKAAGQDEWSAASAAGQDQYRTNVAAGKDQFATDKAAGMDTYETAKAAGGDDYTMQWVDAMDSFSGERNDAVDARQDKAIDDRYKLQHENLIFANDAASYNKRRADQVSDTNTELWNDTSYHNNITAPADFYKDIKSDALMRAGIYGEKAEDAEETYEESKTKSQNDQDQRKQVIANAATWGAGGGNSGGGISYEEGGNSRPEIANPWADDDDEDD